MTRTFTAFSGDCWIGTGDEAEIRSAVSAMGEDAPLILTFDDATGKQVDIDLREDADGIGATAQPPIHSSAPRGRGRPKLGVQAREVTLLPRHWDWLARQPGGASITLRKLVEEARRKGGSTASPRAAMDAAYHFLTAMAGDRSHYEAAIRSLYAGDGAGFAVASADWPSGIRSHGLALAAPAFSASEASDAKS
jgi:hypothetical protein